MKLNQISLFLENKPGHLGKATQALADKGISILTLSLADTREFGILRLIVKDWQAAKDALTAAGFAVNVTEVVAIEVDDRPGGLNRILNALDKESVNIEYMYAFSTRSSARAVLIFRFSATDIAISALQKNGISVVSGVSLFENGGGCSCC